MKKATEGKKVIYIGGIGRSGSTILDILLNQSDGIFGIGEVTKLDLNDKQNCACGEKLDSCPVWSQVLKQLTSNEIHHLKEAGNSLLRERHLHRFIFSNQWSKQHAEASDKLFDLLFDVTDADFLVDSSKNLSRAIALLRASRFDVYFVHMIRDPRGYINSLNKDRGQNLQHTKPMLRWFIKNTIASTIVRHFASGKYIMARYEDLMMNPTNFFEKIADLLNYDLSQTILSAVESIECSDYHQYYGNPPLLQQQTIRFEPRTVEYQLKGISDKSFRYRWGWLARFWGYM